MAKISSGAMAHINNAHGDSGTRVDPLGDYYFCPINTVESNCICGDGNLGLVLFAALNKKGMTRDRHI